MNYDRFYVVLCVVSWLLIFAGVSVWKVRDDRIDESWLHGSFVAKYHVASFLPRSLSQPTGFISGRRQPRRRYKAHAFLMVQR